MNEKQVIFDSKLSYSFVYDYLKIRVLHGFAYVWKVAADRLKIMISLACKGKRKFKFEK